MATLSEKQAALFTDRNWGVIATIREDGSPQATPVWIDYDGENVLVNSAYGRTKVKNIERDPRATVTVLPAEDQQSGYVMVSGPAEIVEEGALEHLNKLAKKYLGEDKYPYLGPGERRVIIQIHPELVEQYLHVSELVIVAMIAHQFRTTPPENLAINPKHRKHDVVLHVARTQRLIVIVDDGDGILRSGHCVMG